ncbi:DUF808 domain-containing protein [Corynebacterium lizhenjunii]|uniref:DUF808 domain-containing protein n=1 Tax=Corynebacterium lizhenjunii TaxID=2709394 RepID=A0A7T0KFN3_9CORY|nr:DUF808 domain-containing protein [Corynebacterium lizhenjunii]QPK79911.1 DUF808 domain-containing protein [Corynebacterium lizhenjunii]
MAGGLLALLDDVAALAAKTSAKAAGVVIDDAAVAPQYFEGVSPARELPMIWRITKGSLINKLVVILPILLVLSWIAPWALTPILMAGGTFLCFEGAHKILHRFLPHEEQAEEAADEDALVSSAVTTDFILSAEIMVISLNAVIAEPFWMRLVVLIVVGIFITVGVYGVVGLLVKMDDIGLRLLERSNGSSFLGSILVKAMPVLMRIISIVGTAAMLWVGGHIVINGLHEFGQDEAYDILHHATQNFSGATAWLIESGISAAFGFLLGAVVLSVVEFLKAVIKRTTATTTP